MFAVCGSGGSDAIAWLIVALAFAAWLAVAVLIVRAARDRTEQRFLIGLLIGSIVVGPLILWGFFEDVFGSDKDIVRLGLLLIVPGAIGAGVAYMTRAAHGIRAFAISTWGALLLGGAYVVILIAFLAVGNACLE